MKPPPGFDWDPEHAAEVLRRTGHSFLDAVHVFQDEEFDYLRVGPEERNGESRYRAIGRLPWGSVVVVAYTMRHGLRRLVWIRTANRKEEKAFYDAQ